MPRLLIISEDWPVTAGSALARSLSGAGMDVDAVRNERSPAVAGSEPGPVRVVGIPFEPQRHDGRLFGLRNTLFFGTAANPGNYSQLRDRLHMHLQDVLYDAVVIFCPPQPYLRLGYWISQTFGIPVWIHLTQALDDAGTSGFTTWNHRRLRRKYLAAATLITAGTSGVLRSVQRQQEQLMFIAAGQDDMYFQDPETNAVIAAGELVRRFIRRTGAEE